MKKKKIILGALLAALSTALLASCGNKKDDNVDTSNISTSAWNSTNISSSDLREPSHWEPITIEELKSLYQNKETPSYNCIKIQNKVYGPDKTIYIIFIDGEDFYTQEPIIYNSKKTFRLHRLFSPSSLYFPQEKYCQAYLTTYMNEENIFNLKDDDHYEYFQSIVTQEGIKYKEASDLSIVKSQYNEVIITEISDVKDVDYSTYDLKRMRRFWFDEYFSINEYQYTSEYSEDISSIHTQWSYYNIDLSSINYVIVED